MSNEIKVTDFKSYSKKRLIKEIVELSNKFNGNEVGISKGFQDRIEIFPKRHLIKTLMILKMMDIKINQQLKNQEVLN